MYPRYRPCICYYKIPLPVLHLLGLKRKFIFVFREKIIRKYTKITKIFEKIEAKIFAKTKIEAEISTHTYAKILLFGIIIFWPDFFTIIWQKFSRNEISQKLPHLRMIFAFRENEKNRFRFKPSIYCSIQNFFIWTSTKVVSRSHRMWGRGI
jgi:hypothetical protein